MTTSPQAFSPPLAAPMPIHWAIWLPAMDGVLPLRFAV